MSNPLYIILPVQILLLFGACSSTKANPQFYAPRNDHERLVALEAMRSPSINTSLSAKHLLDAGLGSEYYYSYHLEQAGKANRAFDMVIAGIHNNNPWFEYNALRAYTLSHSDKHNLYVLRKQIRKLNAEHQKAPAILYIQAQIAYQGKHFRESLQLLNQIHLDTSTHLQLATSIKTLEILNNMQLHNPYWQKSVEDYLLTWPINPKFIFIVNEIAGRSNPQEFPILPLLVVMKQMKESPHVNHFHNITQFIDNWGAPAFFNQYPQFIRIYIQLAGQVNQRIESIEWLQSIITSGASLSTQAHFEIKRGIAVMQWRLGRYQASSESFAPLVSMTNNNDDYNDILWYYLYSLYRYNLDDFLAFVVQRSPQISENPAWFDDIFQTILRDLVATEDFSNLHLIHKHLINTQASSSMRASYAWVLARAMYHNFLPKDSAQIAAYLNEALLDPFSYAAFMAATTLNETPPALYGANTHTIPSLSNFTDETAILSVDKKSPTLSLFASTVATSASITPDLHLLGFLYYNLPQLAISHSQVERKYLQIDTLRLAARNLNEQGLYLEAIRMMNRAKTHEFFQPDRTDLMVLYPLAFFDEIDKAAKSINFPTNIYLALIRTESGFSPEIQSRVAATGLAQVMPATAKDMAKRLNIPEADINLTDIEQNLLLSSQYLQWIEGRLDGRYAQLAGYNGGPNRVRRWREEWKNLPDELFVEAIPYAETRNYVKSIVVSAAVYSYLYSNEAPIFVIGEIFPKFNPTRSHASQ